LVAAFNVQLVMAQKTLVFLRNSLVFPLSKIILTFSLTLSPVRPMLSAVNKTLRQKLLSLLFQSITYAALGYAFFFVFFRSQF
jgi:hypothetical protein